MTNEQIKGEIDWQRVRVDAAIVAIGGMLGHEESMRWTKEEIAFDAVMLADALVAELKKRKAK